MVKIRIGLGVLMILMATEAFARKPKIQALQIIEAQIQSCHDGDTCTAFSEEIDTRDSEKIKIRFAGIDAPESKQRFGQDSRQALEERIKGQRVRLECRGKSFERRTCVVFLGSENINEWMVREGWAWESPKYSKGAYTEAQNSARAAGKGLWGQAENHSQSPYCFRHNKTKNCRFLQSYNP